MKRILHLFSKPATPLSSAEAARQRAAYDHKATMLLRELIECYDGNLGIRHIVLQARVLLREKRP